VGKAPNCMWNKALEMRDPSATNLRNGARPPMHATAQVLVHSTITSHGATYRTILISEHTTSHKHSKGYWAEGSDIIRPLRGLPPGVKQSLIKPRRGALKKLTQQGPRRTARVPTVWTGECFIGCLFMQSTGKILLDAATNAALKRPPKV
jgi:hypothetical protein